MRVLIILLLLSTSLSSQHYESFECPVSIDGQTLKYPFTGGFSNPQFSEFDFDRDGLLDLFVFDKQGDASMVFLRNVTDNEFTFTKEYNQYLPLELTNFCLVNDFNRDGIVDLFTSAIPLGVAGVMLYQGSSVGDGYGFRRRRMGRVDPNSAPAIWNRLNNAQVYVASTDVPAVADVDFDGDLDILSFDSGGSYVVYNRNFQVENGLPNDTMDFRVDDICFGKFEEGGMNQDITLSPNPATCAFEPQPNIEGDLNNSNSLKSGGAHSGSTVLAFDPDEDFDTDLILGDLLYNGMVFLENGGSPNEDYMTGVDPTFPSSSLPIDMKVFLAAYNIDVDNDGLKDLIAAPNSIGIIQDFNSIWYYKNNGIGPDQFSLRKKDFLQDQTIDFGSFTAPVFVDHNMDGLMDILVGQGGSLCGEQAMSLVLFENVGTKTNPSFVLKDDDYLGFSEFVTTSKNPSPAFGDMDNDGDLDLIIGDNVGYLYYYENVAGAGQTLAFEAKGYKYMDINIGNAAKPFIIDFNQDGLMDLVIGEEKTNGFELPSQEFITGNINYFENIGKASEPLFNNDIFMGNNTSTLGRIKVSFTLNTAIDGGAAPFFFRKDDKLNVIVGSKSGRIVHHEFNSTEPNDEAPVVNDYLGFLKEGNDSSPAMYDINDDGFYEILIGTSRGGLAFYKTDIDVGTSSNVSPEIVEDELIVFPNPTNSLVTIQHKKYKAIESIEVHNATGQLIKKVLNKNEVNLSQERAGVYYFSIKGKDFYVTKSISLIK